MVGDWVELQGPLQAWGTYIEGQSLICHAASAGLLEVPQ